MFLKLYFSSFQDPCYDPHHVSITYIMYHVSKQRIIIYVSTISTVSNICLFNFLLQLCTNHRKGISLLEINYIELTLSNTNSFTNNQ